MMDKEMTALDLDGFHLQQTNLQTYKSETK